MATRKRNNAADTFRECGTSEHDSFGYRVGDDMDALLAEYGIDG
ncbi:hypothetical protein [Cupriavidus pinatubonensis]